MNLRALSIEFRHSEQQRENYLKKKGKEEEDEGTGLRGLVGQQEKIQLLYHWRPRRRGENETEKLIKEIMAENFQNSAKL